MGEEGEEEEEVMMGCCRGKEMAKKWQDGPTRESAVLKKEGPGPGTPAVVGSSFGD